jgi:hypothetical protein
MTQNQSIVKKAESAIDDLIDLWRRRKATCIIVIMIMVIPSGLTVYLQFHKVPGLESTIEDKNQRILDLDKNLEDAINARDKAEIRLAPFLAAAEGNFPKAPPDEGLELLMDKLDEVATLEGQKRTLAILERMQSVKRTDHDVLSKKYPEGYFLFASDRYTVIPPSEIVKDKLTLDWENTKVKFIDDRVVHVLLKELCYQPTKNIVRDLNVLLEREVGVIADGIFFDKVGLYVELLNDEADKLIYVIGFKKGEPVTRSRKLKSSFKGYLKRLTPGLLFGPMVLGENYSQLNGLTITSAWDG